MKGSTPGHCPTAHLLSGLRLLNENGQPGVVILVLQGRGKWCEATAVLQRQVKCRVGKEVRRARWVTGRYGDMDGTPTFCVLEGRGGATRRGEVTVQSQLVTLNRPPTF